MRDQFFGQTRGSNLASLDCSVHISDGVIERITDTVLHSSIEEGGKFLGRVARQGRELVITVETYIDSGPRVHNSAVSLYPDGKYQEALFRAVESFYPEIEHLGSWHSHHCNGASDLSGADISGYIQSVNDPNYNLDCFFVLLVTALRRRQIQPRYYLFFRGTTEHIELSESQIHRFPGTCVVEPFLREAERVTLLHRTRSAVAMDESRVRPAFGCTSPVDRLKEIRGQDKQWLSQTFPSARALKNRKDGSISWQWSVSIDSRRLRIRYRYPTPAAHPTSDSALMELSFERMVLLTKEIPLDADRFRLILQIIEEAGRS